MLLCTVRNCRQPLERETRRALCPRGHSFDVARSGYLNLLQPHDRRSRNPGDTPAAVAGRRLVHDSGATAPLLDGIADLLRLSGSDVVLDAGCGEGFYLGGLAMRTGCRAHGLDISIPAIDAAARRYAGCEWVVANADRFVPYSDAAFTAVVSITGRMNPTEFRRVLQDGGRLLAALAGPGDLIELRGPGRDRVERTVADFAPQFQLTAHRRVSASAHLNEREWEALSHSIYRPIPPDRARAAAVTFSLDLLQFHPSRPYRKTLDSPI